MATRKPLVSIDGQYQLLSAVDTIPLTAVPVMTATTGGAVPTPPNNTTTFLRGDGTYATPAGGGAASPWSLVKQSVDVGETLTIPLGYQLIVVRTFTNLGTINNSGEMHIL